MKEYMLFTKMRKLLVLIALFLLFSLSAQASLVTSNAGVRRDVSKTGRIILNSSAQWFRLSEPGLSQAVRYIRASHESGHLHPATSAFTGREYEPELGLSFHRNRYYDPSIGRFISRDPVFGNITNPITQHPYVYGNLSPYRYTDPDGRLAFGLIDAGEEDAKLLARHYATEYAREGGMLNLAKVAIYSPWSDDTASTITAGTVIVGGGALVYVGGAYAFAQAQAVIATAGTATTGMLEKFKQWLHGGKNVAYEAAQAGGKHAGTLKNYSDRSIAEIQKAISSYGDQVSLHQQKIANPAQFIERWAELPSSHQANILRKWASDAARNQELSDVLRGLWRSK